MAAMPGEKDVKPTGASVASGNGAKNGASHVCDEAFVRAAVNEAVGDTIGDAPYLHDSTTQWTNTIVESLVRKFVTLDRENKYIGT